MFYFVEGSDSREILYNAWCVNWPIILALATFIYQNRNVLTRSFGYLVVQEVLLIIIGLVYPMDRFTWSLLSFTLLPSIFIFARDIFQRIM